MSETLANRIAAALERPVDAAVAAYARRLGVEAGAQAVLFYGSNLRTGSLDGVLDFYVLLPGAITAARLAAAVGPSRGTAEDFWRALFRATYQAEFRVEKPGRENAILEVNAAHFDGLLPLAWDAGGIAFACHDGLYEPDLPAAERARVLQWWRRRARLGKPLNLLRLAKATTTFDGAADYAAWKLQRHTGITLEVTPFRARHPLLAAPGALFELWRKRRAQR